MKKIIIIVLLFLVLISTAGIIYLNNVFLPETAKSLIIRSIEDTTNKKVTLGSVRINIFKGIVLKDLVIYDNEAQILNVKEASCIFWFWGLIQKKIVIPRVNFNSALVFVERRKDSSFNLTELFVPKRDEPVQPKPVQPLATIGDEIKPLPIAAVSPEIKPSAGFIIEVHRINIVDSRIKFRDNSLKENFSMDLSNVDLSIYLSLPNSLKFKGSARLPDNPKPNIYINGEFKFSQQELKSNIIVNNIDPGKFAAYYRSWEIVFNDGRIDLSGFLILKDNVLGFDCQAKAFNISLSKGKVLGKFNSQSRAGIKYYLNEGRVQYSGSSFFTDTVISGLDFLDSVNISKATVSFSDAGLNSEDILANVWNTPVSAKLRLSNFNDPKLAIDLTSDFDLNYAQGLLKSKFNLALPAKADGRAGLSLNIFTESLNTKPVKFNGYLDIVNASLKLDKIDDLIKEINGRLEFTSDTLKAKEINFKYQDLAYKLSISLKNFQLPDVNLELTSKELLLKSDFKADKTRINISNFSGRYLNSGFNATGSFDTLNSNADITGSCVINLSDLNKPLTKFRDQLDKINPRGEVEARFSFSGDTRDIKGCAVEARISSPQVSLYGLNHKDLSGYYRQQAGVGEIPFLNFSFYGGKVNISAKTNLKSDNLPYAVTLLLEGVKIEELKLDTDAKAKDIAGTINGGVKLNGFSGDLSKISGSGALDITKGKLWELDLFKGMGKLLFAKDFANIIFYEGSCNFAVQDKYIFTDNLTLKSNMASLSGKVKLGFDSSIDASLNIDILDEFVPLSGTLKDLTTTVIGRSGKFTTINITGTLKEPKYKFKPAVENIIRGITDTLRQAIGRKQPQ
ncbi:MAG: AsmA family protein [Candidatus Omnitrophica bacterium]|nr:AsmA family protein [Candidatus Omnitrophota bacterium]